MHIGLYNLSGNVTSDEVNIGRRPGGVKNYLNVYVYGTLGGGSVAIEIKDGNGDFNSFPETMFTEETAQSVEIHDKADIRVVVNGVTDVNVEVR